ncbi:MAG: DUF932 domain-containing protein [Candidatus Hodarchaeota archaeon]
MAFKTQKVEEQLFDSFNDLKDYLSSEKDRFSIVPIENFVKEGAEFINDEYYGKNQDFVCFNEDGFRSFCYAFQLPVVFLLDLPKPGLATDNLNNHLSREDMQEKLKHYSFVIEKNGTVVGVVTESYLGYSNTTFLEEIEAVLPNGFDDYKFQTSYWINTELHLRLLSRKIVAGQSKGEGGVAEDKSHIGIEFRNSLVGTSAIRISYFVYRLLCANGLILSSKMGTGAVYHRGKPETFSMRVEKNILPIIKSLSRTAKFIEKLMEIPYSPEALVAAGGAKEVYKVLALYQSERAERQRLTGKKIRQFDIEKIRQYPERFGGNLTQRVFNSPYRDNQSMFDFVNVFTEFAKTQPPRKRLETEEKAGNLANWLMENKRKFL